MSALILFDFDGTLADTAPDLVAAANRQRIRRDMAPLPYETLRPLASQGARGLLRVALGLQPGDADYEPARLQFLADYAEGSTQQSRLFPGIADLLNHIQAQGLAWGIVTNKVTHLTLPIVEHLDLVRHSAVLVCGDTTAHAKPHPLPLLHAAEQAGYTTDRCVYIGDDLRDIQAAHAAGMPAIAAAYGYVGDGDGEDASHWQAERLVDSPLALWEAIAALLPQDLRP
ncbi:phosphoglycolate phosphatase [Bordetella avium]|uniref:phosphoglycolate phosphatase n=1 Tax=Bordetella avium TaxID=521 RepID=UPI000E0B6EBF|nr:phosphoglycolate phosphatase [Bordetella avium]RIQ14062.1 phosphoglycolate phosphatase [Bordetella avium]RIQ39761.1 phosphoglycolate phosphatase [Bordetella avium]RIQ44559.1 phosphoglycolate phosphatase [Bordetella avium]RIQ45221.1 phosphoglycolate phosphatase [Bordetella avium]RIQ51600.1 phosphoglycolate phosphatase [Bordetella avium]